MMRVGVYRPVHVMTLRSQKLRMLLTIASYCSRRPSLPAVSHLEEIRVSGKQKWMSIVELGQRTIRLGLEPTG
jgi:hypothetical protein